MNCDQVFDILTRGPFPTGTSCDEPVETHLGECEECHRLAEALRPAIELFQEAVDPEESRDLPGYWCVSAAERHSPVLSYTREIEPRPVLSQPDYATSNRQIAPLAAWRMVAMVAIGVTLGMLLSSRALNSIDWPPRGPSVGAAVASPAENEPGFSKADWMELATLPAACYRHKPDRAPRYTLRDDLLLADASLENLNCCSGCHNSGSDNVPGSATLRVLQSCQFCHAEPPARLHSTE